MSERLKDLAILVNSCDKYRDLWDPFFKLFKIYGGELVSCPIYLNTESAQYTYEDLNIICPNNFSEKVEWGERMKKCLEQIDHKYVLFLLDDFFLQREINIDIFDKCISWMNENSDIGSFNLLSIKTSDAPSKKFFPFCIVRKNKKFRINCQAAIWDKEVLNASLINIDNPWEWELEGNLRNRVVLKNKKIYCLSERFPEPFYYNSEFCNKKYSPDTIRNAIIGGKWDLSCVQECFEKNNIDIDYSLRGIYEKDTPPKKRSVIKKMFIPIYSLFLNSRTHFRRLFGKDQAYNRYVRDPLKEIKKERNRI